MKRTLIFAAVAASFAGTAHAQSSVTLYGLIDAGLTYTSNVGGNAKWEQKSGSINQSRWGLRGAEDLGGGLKAIFTLESGFDLGNGRVANNSGLFNRQAFVGLSGEFGTVTLGRQYDAVQDYLAPLTATGSWGGTYFAHVGNLDNLNTNGGSSVNNSVKFTSANYSGLTFGGTYGFSNQAGAFANNREYSVGAAYKNSGLRVAAAYAQQNNAGAANVAGVSNGGASDFGLLGRQRQFGVGAGYTYGPAEVGVAWTQARADNLPTGGSFRVNNYEVNGKYNLTPALGLGVAYTFSDLRDSAFSNDGKNRFHQFGAQADYSLTKRTDVYTQVVYQRATGDGPNAGASIYSGNPLAVSSSSRDQTAATVGLRHRF